MIVPAMVAFPTLPRIRVLRLRPIVVLLSVGVAACSSPTHPSSTPPFDGNWTGRYITEHCIVTGWPECNVNENKSLNLTLTQTGSVVSGTLDLMGRALPVTGTVVNGTLTITGNAVLSNTKASVDSLALTQWSGVVDSQAHMQGTFTYREATTWGIASGMYYPPGETWTVTYDAKLETACRTAGPNVTQCR